MNLSQLDDSSAMLNTLAKIMDKFDIEEIKENPGLFGKLFETSASSWTKSSPSTTPWAMKWTRSMSS